MKKNSILNVKIENMSADGNGVARADGEVIFVPNTAVGDEAEIVIIKELKRYSVGKVRKIITPSDKRVEIDCPVFEKCGGCVFRHVSMKEEERIKKEHVESVMKRIGKIDVEVKDVVTPALCRYRNKTQLPVSEDDKGLHCGFFAPHSHRIIDESTSCIITPKIFGEIAEFILDFLKREGIKGYSEETKAGNVRHLYFRINKNNEIMVTVVTNEKSLGSTETEEKFTRELTAQFPAVVSVFINFNDKDTNVVLSDNFRLIYGKEHFEDQLLGCTFKTSPDSFFQVNRVGAETIYKTAFSLLEEKSYENVYDLYCGVGTIGITLFSEIRNGKVKADAKKLFGIEIVEKAAQCARENAKANGIDNALFKASDSADILKTDWFDKFPPSLVILDPPRKGTTTELLDFLSDQEVKDILYISCDPATLARDMGYLYEKGYTSTAVHPVNLFAGTKHVECCVRLFK